VLQLCISKESRTCQPAADVACKQRQEPSRSSEKRDATSHCSRRTEERSKKKKKKKKKIRDAPHIVKCDDGLFPRMTDRCILLKRPSPTRTIRDGDAAPTCIRNRHDTCVCLNRHDACVCLTESNLEGLLGRERLARLPQLLRRI
jgi:hypothetical protein